MAIRISRNNEGNCITFIGSSNPAYWNACLSAELSDDPGRFHIINDIRSQNEPEIQYEFYNVTYTDFADADGNAFADAQEAVDYINANANVIGLDGGTDMTGVDINFRLDQTSTSILSTTGSQWGVNSVKAVLEINGLISIHSIGEGIPTGSEEVSNKLHYRNIDPVRVSIDGTLAAGGPQDVVNAMNELFTVGAFTQVVVTDPYSTMVADAGGTLTTYTLEGSTAVDPEGTDIFTNSTSGNYAGLLTTETIDQAGEYFTFDIRGEGQIGFGLVHTTDSYNNGYYSGNATYANPAQFAVGNSAHFGYQFSHWFHPTPNGSWTNYGANTSYSMRPGWSNWESKDEWLAGNPVKIKVGIDENGYIAISSLQDDGVTWIVHARTGYPVPDGGEYRLGIKSANPAARVNTAPKVHLLEPAAPTMNFRWIESPDGVYQYPLFATEEEAEYYDQNHAGTTGSGTSHAHVYADDPSGTTWYMPDTGRIMNGSTPPLDAAHTVFMGNTVTYTEITSLTDADLVPPAFTAVNLTVDELTNVNYQTQPVGTAYTTTITGLPSGLIDGGYGMITGTAPEVAQDLVTNPSDTYTITVTRTNSYGSSTGTFDIIVNNLTPVPTTIAGFTHIATSATMVDGDTLADGSAVTIDNVLEDGKRIVFSRSWIETYVRDTLQTGTNQKIFIGVARTSPAASWGSIDTPDFQYGFQFEKGSTSSGLYVRKILNGSIVSNTTYSVFANDLVFYHDHSVSGYMMANLPNGGAGATVATPTYTNNEYGTVGSGDVTFVIAAVGTTMDLSTTGISEVNNPVVSTSLTSWSKAVDFDGSNERAQQVTQDSNRIPVKMSGINNNVPAPASAGNTSSDSNSRPWATAIVFTTTTYNDNQHIWNVGEGSGTTDDNIYLRRSTDRKLYFGWGRQGEVNEMLIHPAGTAEGWSLTPGNWYGIYIASNGTRLGSGHSAADIAAAFDIRLMGSSQNWATAGYSDTNLSDAAAWTAGSFGARMNRQLTGDMTIGGRGSNRSFRGKVASFVSTTLRKGVAMPSNAEIEMMIVDPKRWLQDYKVGNAFRLPWQGNDAGFNFSLNDGSSAYSTQVWLMGNGTNDSYSNMIRNQVQPSDQNYTKLNLISMVSNDIVNVTINGLS